VTLITGQGPPTTDIFGIQRVFKRCFASVNSPPRDHSGVAGGFTRRMGEKLEVVSPQQDSRPGGDTLTSSTQSHAATLRLNPIFRRWWVSARFPPKLKPLRNRFGVAGGFTWRISRKFEVGSPQQVLGGGRDTFTPGSQGQGADFGARSNLESWCRTRAHADTRPGLAYG